MRENNTQHSIKLAIKKDALVFWALLLLFFSCKTGPVKNEAFRLNPVLDSPYHFVVHTSELHSKYGKPTERQSAFELIFETVTDSVYGFTFQFTFIDTFLLRYLDQMDSMRNRVSNAQDAIHRFKYSQAFDETKRELFRGRVRSNGLMLSVTGYDEMNRRISRLLELDSRDLYSVLHEVASDENVEKLLNMIFFSVPGRKVNIGDTWVRNVLDNTRAPLKHSHLITFHALNGDTAILKLQTELSAKTGDKGSLFESGKGIGEWKVDRQSGIPFEWHTRNVSIYRTDFDTSTRTVIVKGSIMN